MDLDVQMALDYWRRINALPRSWARFEAIFEPFRAVVVEYGSIHTDGTKEQALGVRMFVLRSDGKVDIVNTVH